MTGENPELKPSVRVVQAVGESKGVSPGDLPPLYESIDPDALDTLLNDTPTIRQVNFDYLGYSVTVEVTGRDAVTVDLQKKREPAVAELGD